MIYIEHFDLYRSWYTLLQVVGYFQRHRSQVAEFEKTQQTFCRSTAMREKATCPSHLHVNPSTYKSQVFLLIK